MSMTKEDLLAYRKANLTADNMVFAAAGAVDHAELVKLAEKHLSNFPKSNAESKSLERAKFVGAEVRLRDDTWEDCHIAIAVEGVPESHPDYWTMVSCLSCGWSVDEVV
jgi:processing peptidase subunit beta